jgi:hypothetical protein
MPDVTRDSPTDQFRHRGIDTPRLTLENQRQIVRQEDGGARHMSILAYSAPASIKANGPSACTGGAVLSPD